MATPAVEAAWNRPFSLMPALPEGADFWDYKDSPSVVMQWVHNAFVRSLNFMCWQAPRIEKDKLKDFVAYALLWGEMLHHHHHLEETIYFPMLEKYMGKGSLKDNADQHHEFMPAVDAFNAYLKVVQSDNSKWDAAQFRRHVDDFGEPMAKHLFDELDTLRPDKIGPAMNNKQYWEINAAVDNAIKEEMPLVSLAWVLANHPHATHPQAKDWPILPWPIRNLLVRGYTWQMNTHLLQFGVCDRWGRLKPIPAEAQ